jgi:hypothetical protein
MDGHTVERQKMKGHIVTVATGGQGAVLRAAGWYSRLLRHSLRGAGQANSAQLCCSQVRGVHP